MAASVIRTLSGFGRVGSESPCFLPTEEDEFDEDYEEELREEVEDSFEDEDCAVRVTEAWTPEPCYTETTDRLLRFAELISSDVRRYFGNGPRQDSESCDLYEGRPSPAASGRQRYYADVIKATSPDRGDGAEKLGPLAELFQETHLKKQGLPMIQRHLPSSFWTEPCPDHLENRANASDFLNCPTETASTNADALITSSNTLDFSDLLAHWASERENPTEFSCDYQLP